MGSPYTHTLTHTHKHHKYNGEFTWLHNNKYIQLFSINSANLFVSLGPSWGSFEFNRPRQQANTEKSTIFYTTISNCINAVRKTTFFNVKLDNVIKYTVHVSGLGEQNVIIERAERFEQPRTPCLQVHTYWINSF